MSEPWKIRLICWINIKPYSFKQVTSYWFVWFVQQLGVMAIVKINSLQEICLLRLVKGCGTTALLVGDVTDWGAWVALINPARVVVLRWRWWISALNLLALQPSSCPMMLLLPSPALLEKSTLNMPSTYLFFLFTLILLFSPLSSYSTLIVLAGYDFDIIQLQ